MIMTILVISMVDRAVLTNLFSNKSKHILEGNDVTHDWLTAYKSYNVNYVIHEANRAFNKNK